MGPSFGVCAQPPGSCGDDSSTTIVTGGGLGVFQHPTPQGAMLRISRHQLEPTLLVEQATNLGGYAIKGGAITEGIEDGLHG